MFLFLKILIVLFLRKRHNQFFSFLFQFFLATKQIKEWGKKQLLGLLLNNWANGYLKKCRKRVKCTKWNQFKEKKKKRKRWRVNKRKRWERRKWDLTNKYHDYAAKLRKTWFSELGIGTVELGGVEPLKREEMMREREREIERDIRRKWEKSVFDSSVFFFFNYYYSFNHWIAFIPRVTHPI